MKEIKKKVGTFIYEDDLIIGTVQNLFYHTNLLMIYEKEKEKTHF